ncbi:hypothetical protein NQZ68_011405 [Dissostichus eleginoides]|nr:hypothetical protein NQZ68_011405 [Dissostichus eleginoides]
MSVRTGVCGEEIISHQRLRRHQYISSECVSDTRTPAVPSATSEHRGKEKEREIELIPPSSLYPPPLHLPSGLDPVKTVL